jgi:hypothetical protein
VLGGIVVQTVIALVVAALATSRATGHRLSPLAMAAMVAGAAGTGGLIGWLSGLFAGAADFIAGDVKTECGPDCALARPGDPWAAGTMWRHAWMLALLIGLWAFAGGGLVAVILNGRQAPLVVLFAALAGLSGSAAVTVDMAARHRGAHGAERTLAHPLARQVSLRRRAWLQVALPLAMTQIAVNVWMAWVLFHDYAVHDSFAPRALTRSAALADVPVIVTLLALVFAVVLARPWGEVDARLGRVTLDDPRFQAVTAKSPIGGQGIVYAAFVGLVFAKLAALVLPAQPTLVEVMAVRGIYAGLLVLVFTAGGYVRGAVNALGESHPERQGTPS